MIFDPELHEYWNDAHTIQYPSVTQILTEAGVIDGRWYTIEARDRGSAVHSFCERYAQGERHDKKFRALESLEYVNAFSKWIKDKGAYAIATECRVSHMINGKIYAGTFDILADISGKRVLVDIKTGARAKWHAIQLAAYSMAHLESGESVNPDSVAALYLQADGSYRYEPVPGARLVEAIQQFKECLSNGN